MEHNLTALPHMDEDAHHFSSLKVTAGRAPGHAQHSGCRSLGCGSTSACVVSPGGPVAVQDLRARGGVPAVRGLVEGGPAKRQPVVQGGARRQHPPAATVQPPHVVPAAGEEIVTPSTPHPLLHGPNSPSLSPTLQLAEDVPQSPTAAPLTFSTSFDLIAVSVEISERLQNFCRWSRRMLRQLQKQSRCPRR